MYINIPKPTGAPYTRVRNGYPLYDDSTVAYDSSSSYFDGDSPQAYTNIAKPLNDSATWDTITTTWNTETRKWNDTDSYLNVNKPT